MSLVLTDDDSIQEINAKWRNKSRPTDVLSFPQYTVDELNEISRQAEEDSLDAWVLGDIVISLETAKRQANLFGFTFIEEVERLFIHGFVHLLGYDHEINAKEARRMKRIERILLTR